MIFNIHGFQHSKLLEFGLDNDDALILRAITGMYASPKMEHTTIDGLRYIWVNQSYLQRQVEIIGSKRTVMRRVNKMIEKGILLSHTLYSKKGVKGTYYYIAPTEKLDRLRDIEPYDKVSKGQAEPYDKVSKDCKTKCQTKDTNNNIDNNNNIELCPEEEKTSERIPYKEIIEYLNEKANRKFNFKAKKNRDLIKARVNEGYTLNDFKKVIDNKVNDWLDSEKMNQYLRPMTLFGNKFDSYLNEVIDNRPDEVDFDKLYKRNEKGDLVHRSTGKRVNKVWIGRYTEKDVDPSNFKSNWLEGFTE